MPLSDSEPLTTTAGAYPGRSSRFRATQDLVIVSEVAATKAHTASFGETKKLFQQAAEIVRENPAFSESKTVT